MKTTVAIEIVVSFLLFPLFLIGQNNMLDTSVWTVGPGTTTVPGFSNYGPAEENERILGTDPHGNMSVLWVSKPDGATTNTEDGGFMSSQIYVEESKTYRFAVWIKKTGSDSGNSYLGLRCFDPAGAYATQRFDGTINNNPYFWSGDLPELDKWFLVVGYIHPNSYTGNHIGGVYDGITGVKVTSQSVTDYKFAVGANRIWHRSILFANRNATDRQYYWNPSIYEVNGLEPSISELINPSGSSDTSPPTAPTLSSLTLTETTVDLSWTAATDNVGVTGYKIYRDGTEIESNITATSYQATGLTASTSYDFKVRAFDAAGNESVDSNIESATTNAASSGGSSIWTESGTTASYTGEVAVGTAAVPAGYKFVVDGNIRTREIRVDQDTWPDYVFKESYNLPSLEEIQKHIEEKGHLPNIPSAQDAEANGVELGEMDRLLLEKIEEMMLHIIQLNELIKQQKEINIELKKELETLKNN